MRKNSTIMAQMLHVILRYDFKKVVDTYKADKFSKGFTCWHQFSSLLFGQLSGLDSLRSITNNLAARQNSLYHLGLKPVKRSTLSYANSNRNYQVYRDLFFTILSKVQGIAPRHSFRLPNRIYSIDSTTIDLCLSVYDWAQGVRVEISH